MTNLTVPPLLEKKLSIIHGIKSGKNTAFYTRSDNSISRKEKLGEEVTVYFDESGEVVKIEITGIDLFYMKVDS